MYVWPFHFKISSAPVIVIFVVTLGNVIRFNLSNYNDSIFTFINIKLIAEILAFKLHFSSFTVFLAAP